MEDAGFVVSIALAVISLISAGFAAWQAYEARQSRLQAQSAAADSVRMVAAMEAQAEAQQEIARQGVPGDWSPLKQRDGQLYVTRNTSGRTLTVHRIDAEPKNTPGLVMSRAPLPVTVRNGGELRLLIRSRHALHVRSVKLLWSDGENEVVQEELFL